MNASEFRPWGSAEVDYLRELKRLNDKQLLAKFYEKFPQADPPKGSGAMTKREVIMNNLCTQFIYEWKANRNIELTRMDEKILRSNYKRIFPLGKANDRINYIIALLGKDMGS